MSDITQSHETPEIEGEGDCRSERDLLAVFFGKNSSRYLKKYDNTINKKFAINFNFAVFFAPIAWCFYRKMYLYGALFLIIPVVIGVIFPSLLDSLHYSAAVFAVLMDGVYIDYAQRKIKKIEAEPLSDEEKNELIARTGGVSLPGLVLGLGITIGVLGLMVFSALAEKGSDSPGMAGAELPACDSKAVVDHVEKANVEAAKARNLPIGSASAEFVEELPSENTAELRKCRYKFKSEGTFSDLELHVFWVDEATKRFTMRIAP